MFVQFVVVAASAFVVVVVPVVVVFVVVVVTVVVVVVAVVFIVAAVSTKASALRATCWDPKPGHLERQALTIMSLLSRDPTKSRIGKQN